MKRRLTKQNLALVFFTLTLILSIVGMFLMVSIYHPSYAIYATKLNHKPSSCFVLNNPDKHVLEAISNQHSSFFSSLDETQIDEVTGNYGVNVIEYNGAYYETAILFGDNFPPFLLPQILLSGIIASTVAIAAISLHITTKYIKSRVS